MRKNVQQQMIELVSSVLEGIMYVSSSTTKKSNAIMVLQDCHVAVEAVIDSLKISLSEERFLFYKKINMEICDMIEQFNNNIVQDICGSFVSNNIVKQLERVSKELINESEVKLEIVFMPYKASMWDSLESIWYNADKDPNCECYVIPLPYYEKNSDGSLGEYKYEGGDFPDNVPITHYSSYDLSVRNPDVIYIHNPFDQYNYITSINPFYYSSELKKYTEMLVYVPYFITGGDVPENQMVLSVFNHMDLMVVQSEKYKQVYSKILPESKLLALGSPKVDRMIYYNNNKPVISQEWLKAIGNKKIVMYNTSISGILKDGIKAIKKMEYIFSAFKKRDDVLLLWRPHPLIESTLKTMRPALLLDYNEVKNKYIVNNIGIYDDTADVTYSIAISDAYIGEDTSSMVHLFGVTGKPILLTNTEIIQVPTKEDITSVSFHDCYFEKDTAWFVCNGYNALCKMDLNNGNIEVVAQIPLKTNVTQVGQYCDIIRFEDKIIMLPMNSFEICEYDLLKKTFKKTLIPDSVYPNFDRMIRYKDYLFMKPKRYPAIVRYNIKTGVCKYYKKCIKEFYELSDNRPMFMWAVCVRDNLLLMASSIVNKVVEFNMDTGKSKVYTVGSEEMNYFGMEFDGTDYWLIPNEGKTIVKWNYETGKTTEYCDYPENFIGDTRGFVGIVCCGTYMLAFPREANMIIKVDIGTGNMSEFKMNLPYKEGERKSSYGIIWNSNYYFIKRYDEKYVAALTSYDNSLLIINTETEEYIIKKCRLRIEDVRQCISKQEYFCRWNDSIPYASKESQYFNLDIFIDDYIMAEKGHDKEAQLKAYSSVINNMDGTCGQKVHEYIKEQL